jgi:hypothetical protein
MALTPPGPWLAILERQCPAGDPPGWDDVLAGHDFSLLPNEEIQRWAASRPNPGPAARALAGLAGDDLAGFEVALWAAVAEAAGSTPRPGSVRWARAQDRWRLALLEDALVSPLSDPALAVLVEAIYIAVGCPEDMLGLWHRPPRSQAPGTPDRARIQAFVAALKASLAPRHDRSVTWKHASDPQGSGIPL